MEGEIPETIRHIAVHPWSGKDAGTMETRRPRLTGSHTGANIKQAYEAAGFNRAEFARALPADYKTVWNWEQGKASPREDSLARAAELTGYSMDELRGRESRVEPDTDTAAAYPVVDQFIASMGDEMHPEDAERLRGVRWSHGDPDWVEVEYTYQGIRAARLGRRREAQKVEPGSRPADKTPLRRRKK